MAATQEVIQTVLASLAKFELTFEPVDPVLADLQAEVSKVMARHFPTMPAPTATTAIAPATAPKAKGTRGAKSGNVSCYNVYMEQFKAEWDTYKNAPLASGEAKKLSYNEYTEHHRAQWKELSKNEAFKKEWQEKAKVRSQEKQAAKGTPVAASS
jgi:hypothetical protein